MISCKALGYPDFSVETQPSRPSTFGRLRLLPLCLWRGPPWCLVAQIEPEMLAQSLGQEDLLEEKMANHSNILAWNISRTEISGGDLTRGDCNDHLGVEDIVWLEGEQVLLAALWVRDARPSKACQSVYYSLAFSQSSCGTDSHSTVACSPRAVEELVTFSSISPLGRRRRWHPTPVLLPGKSHGQRSLVGCSPWGHTELDTTEWLPFHFSLSCIGEGNGNPLQCSCLENPRDWGAWWAAVYGVAQSWTQLTWLSSSSSNPLGHRFHWDPGERYRKACQLHLLQAPFSGIAWPKSGWKKGCPQMIRFFPTCFWFSGELDVKTSMTVPLLAACELLGD